MSLCRTRHNVLFVNNTLCFTHTVLFANNNNILLFEPQHCAGFEQGQRLAVKQQQCLVSEQKRDPVFGREDMGVGH